MTPDWHLSPVLRPFSGLLPSFNGLEVHVTDHVPLTEVRTDIPLLRFAHGRNHREWRRLVRERRKHSKLITRRDAYVMGGKMFIDPVSWRTLRDHFDEG